MTSAQTDDAMLQPSGVPVVGTGTTSLDLEGLPSSARVYQEPCRQPKKRNGGSGKFAVGKQRRRSGTQTMRLFLERSDRQEKPLRAKGSSSHQLMQRSREEGWKRRGLECWLTNQGRFWLPGTGTGPARRARNPNGWVPPVPRCTHETYVWRCRTCFVRSSRNLIDRLICAKFSVCVLYPFDVSANPPCKHRRVSGPETSAPHYPSPFRTHPGSATVGSSPVALLPGLDFLLPNR